MATGGTGGREQGSCVHAINNGPSGIILPNGRYVFSSTPFVRSEAVADMPYFATSGGSFFTHYPHLFIGLVYGAFVTVASQRLWSELGRARLCHRSASELSCLANSSGFASKE